MMLSTSGGMDALFLRWDSGVTSAEAIVARLPLINMSDRCPHLRLHADQLWPTLSYKRTTRPPVERKGVNVYHILLSFEQQTHTIGML